MLKMAKKFWGILFLCFFINANEVEASEVVQSPMSVLPGESYHLTIPPFVYPREEKIDPEQELVKFNSIHFGINGGDGWHGTLIEGIRLPPMSLIFEELSTADDVAYIRVEIGPNGSGVAPFTKEVTYEEFLKQGMTITLEDLSNTQSNYSYVYLDIIPLDSQKIRFSENVFSEIKLLDNLEFDVVAAKDYTLNTAISIFTFLRGTDLYGYPGLVNQTKHYTSYHEDAKDINLTISPLKDQYQTGDELNLTVEPNHLYEGYPVNLGLQRFIFNDTDYIHTEYEYEPWDIDNYMNHLERLRQHEIFENMTDNEFIDEVNKSYVWNERNNSLPVFMIGKSIGDDAISFGLKKSVSIKIPEDYTEREISLVSSLLVPNTNKGYTNEGRHYVEDRDYSEHYHEKVLSLRLKRSKVTTLYLDEQGQQLTDSIVQEGNVGTGYHTEKKHFENYTLIEEPKNSSGVFLDDNQEVIYNYREKTEESSTETIDSSESPDKKNDKVNQFISDKKEKEKILPRTGSRKSTSAIILGILLLTISLIVLLRKNYKKTNVS